MRSQLIALYQSAGTVTLYIRGDGLSGVWAEHPFQPNVSSAQAQKVKGLPTGEIVLMGATPSRIFNPSTETWYDVPFTLTGSTTIRHMHASHFGDGGIHASSGENVVRWTGSAWNVITIPGWTDTSHGIWASDDGQDIWVLAGSGTNERLWHSQNGGSTWTDRWSEILVARAAEGWASGIGIDVFGISKDEVYFLLGRVGGFGGWYVYMWNGSTIVGQPNGDVTSGGYTENIWGTAGDLWVGNTVNLLGAYKYETGSWVKKVVVDGPTSDPGSDFEGLSDGSVLATTVSWPGAVQSYGLNESIDGGQNFYRVTGVPATSLVWSGIGVVGGINEDPPIVQNEDPAPDAENVNRYTNITLDIIDLDPGVDPDTVVISVESVIVWQNDGPANGWAGSKSSITDGFRYVLDNPSVFEPRQVVNVNVVAEDLYGNSVTKSYSFTIYVSLAVRHSMDVLVNEVAAPTPNNVWNQFDEHGALVGISRNRGEENWEYKRRILDAFVHIANSSYNGLVYAATRELGLSLTNPLRINPKASSVDGRFFATDPYIKFDGAYLYLYSDYANSVLDYKIDRYIPGNNYERLIWLVAFINSTTYFEASLEADTDPYMSSMCILNQTNRKRVRNEEVPISTRFKLEENHIVSGSTLFTDTETFGTEVSLESLVSSLGKYWIDYARGIIRTYRPPAPGSSVGYEYSKYPFLPEASPVVLHDINSEAFRVKMFEQVLQDDGTYTHGIPTEIGVDIINELMSVAPMYWGGPERPSITGVAPEIAEPVEDVITGTTSTYGTATLGTNTLGG